MKREIPAFSPEFTYVDVRSTLGDRPYGPLYVNRLIHAIDTHTSFPHTHLCLTDDPSLPYLCPTEPIPDKVEYKGWWAKVFLFRSRTQPIIYLDLDTIILQNIDFLFSPSAAMTILSDFYSPNRWNSSLISLPPGNFGLEVWERYSPRVPQLFRSDQDWIYYTLALNPRNSSDGVIGTWQTRFPGKIVSYKGSGRKQPQDAAIVCFHGRPKPHELQGTEWVQRAWSGLPSPKTPEFSISPAS